MKTSAQRARATTSTTAVKSVKVEKNATQKTIQKANPKTTTKPSPTARPKSTPKVVAKLTAKPGAKPKANPAARSTPAAAPTSLSAKKPAASKANSKVISKVIPRAAPKVAAVKSAIRKDEKIPTLFTDAPDKSAALRATKKRAPKDLATQYGEIEKAARAPIATAAPRKRRNAESRAKLQAVIAPDDGLMQRLARAGAITSAHVASSDSEDATDKPLRAGSTRRSRKWETRCGKCGTSAQYSTPAALCVKCSAILVRD